MKKAAVLLAALLITGAAYAYEIDANSIFRASDSVGLRPYSRYALS